MIMINSIIVKTAACRMLYYTEYGLEINVQDRWHRKEM